MAVGSTLTEKPISFVFKKKRERKILITKDNRSVLKKNERGWKVLTVSSPIELAKDFRRFNPPPIFRVPRLF